VKAKTARRFLRRNEVKIIRMRAKISPQPPSFARRVKEAEKTLRKEVRK
jgi:hypothetical protein